MVVISIISVLASILLPAVGGLLEQARLASCQRRMGAYAMAFHSYRNDNQNKLPALFRTGEPGAPVGAATIWGAPDERLGSSNAGAAREVRAALGSNAMQNLWLIIDGAYMGGGEETFRCPGDSGFKGRTVPEGTGKFGWTDARNFSYGIQFPYAALGPPAPPDAEGGYPELPKDTRTWNFEIGRASGRERV